MKIELSDQDIKILYSIIMKTYKENFKNNIVKNKETDRLCRNLINELSKKEA